MNELNYLDLFSGIGGFRLGLERAGFKFAWTGHSEIDKYANQVYEGHWPESEDLGDVRTITVNKLPRINLITFGFPCQDLSVAGKRAGLHGNRSGLFFEAMRIIEHTKPDIFIFENVKGLLTKTQDWFARCLQEVANLGLYECEWQLLNTRWFLPQNRERVYFVGYLRGTGRPKVFPIGEGNSDTAEGGGERESGLFCVGPDSNYYKGADGKRTMIQIGDIGKGSQAGRVYSAAGVAKTLSDGGGQGAKTGLYEIAPLKFLNRNQKNFDNDAMTIDGANTTGVKSNSGIRRLTPVECARLQGFDDTHCKGLSDTQQYKCYGNAVSVPVVEEIGRRLLT